MWGAKQVCLPSGPNGINTSDVLRVDEYEMWVWSWKIVVGEVEHTDRESDLDVSLGPPGVDLGLAVNELR
jgi:hypothetical protein